MRSRRWPVVSVACSIASFNPLAPSASRSRPSAACFRPETRHCILISRKKTRSCSRSNASILSVHRHLAGDDHRPIRVSLFFNFSDTALWLRTAGSMSR